MARLTALIPFALVPAVLLAQDRGPKIADISQYTGVVNVRRGEETLNVRQIARRILNGDLYDSDQVLTDDQATARVRFADATTVDLQEATQIAVEQRRLAQPTDAGKTIGRRIRLLTGHIVTEVLPSSDVQTDFVTPAGTAACRGTIVDETLAGLQLNLNIGGGGEAQFNQVGGQALWNLPDGSSTLYTLTVNGQGGTDSVTITNNSPFAIDGQLGNQPVQLGPGDGLQMNYGPNGFTLHVNAGGGDDMLLFDPATGQFAPILEGQRVAFADSPIFAANDLPPGPGVNAAGVIVADVNGDNLLDVIALNEGSGTVTTNLASADVAVNLATTSLGSSFPLTIDDFNRGFSLAVGTAPGLGATWFENPAADWCINGNRAEATSMGGTSYIAVDYKTLSTFSFQATFNFSDFAISPFMVINGDPLAPFGSGIDVFYSPDPSTSFLSVSGPTGSNSIATPLPPNPGTDVILELSFDGSQIFGSVSDGGSYNFSVTAPETDPGVNNAVIVGGQFGAPGTIQVDDIIQHN